MEQTQPLVKSASPEAQTRSVFGQGQGQGSGAFAQSSAGQISGFGGYKMQPSQPAEMKQDAKLEDAPQPVTASEAESSNQTDLQSAP